MQGHVGGKLFLWGEYGVLSGVPAAVLALHPLFRLVVRDGLSGSRPADCFHPLSPAGKLVAIAGDRWQANSRIEFLDPLQGRGGLGASTAQYALLWAFLQLGSIEEAWKTYRRLTGAGGADNATKAAPSGADLVGQMVGGWNRIELVRPEEENESVHWSQLPMEAALSDAGAVLLAFSATRLPNRKIATHEHLDQAHVVKRVRDSSFRSELEQISADGNAAVVAADREKLGGVLTEYAEALARSGLELPAAREDRMLVRALPGVLGAKGGGALLADALWVLVDGDRTGESLAGVTRWAEGRGLELVYQSGKELMAGPLQFDLSRSTTEK